VSKLLTHLFF